ncbi:hypothetical protein GCM10023080_062130 [Streptomyces pseudoechinosporeus]
MQRYGDRARQRLKADLSGPGKLLFQHGFHASTCPAPAGSFHCRGNVVTTARDGLRRDRRGFSHGPGFRSAVARTANIGSRAIPPHLQTAGSQRPRHPVRWEAALAEAQEVEVLEKQQVQAMLKVLTCLADQAGEDAIATYPGGFEPVQAKEGPHIGAWDVRLGIREPQWTRHHPARHNALSKWSVKSVP